MYERGTGRVSISVTYKIFDPEDGLKWILLHYIAQRDVVKANYKYFTLYIWGVLTHFWVLFSSHCKNKINF